MVKILTWVSQRKYSFRFRHVSLLKINTILSRSLLGLYYTFIWNMWAMFVCETWSSHLKKSHSKKHVKMYQNILRNLWKPLLQLNALLRCWSICLVLIQTILALPINQKLVELQSCEEENCHTKVVSLAIT